SELRSFGARLAASARAELAEDRRHVMIDRLAGDKEPLGDIGVTQALRDQREPLDLAAGQTRGVVPGRWAGPAAKATHAALAQPAGHNGRRGPRAQSLKLDQRSAQGWLVTRARERERGL